MHFTSLVFRIWRHDQWRSQKCVLRRDLASSFLSPFLSFLLKVGPPINPAIGCLGERFKFPKHRPDEQVG